MRFVRKQQNNRLQPNRRTKRTEISQRNQPQQQPNQQKYSLSLQNDQKFSSSFETRWKGNQQRRKRPHQHGNAIGKLSRRSLLRRKRFSL